MAGNVILRGAEFVIWGEYARGAQSSTYVAECLACRAESGLVGYEQRAAAVWAMEHARELGLDHSQFLVTTRHHWRAQPHEQPHHVQAAPPPCGRAAHARPPTGGLLAALAGVWRQAVQPRRR
jgi:hypothetical protein